VDIEKRARGAGGEGLALRDGFRYLAGDQEAKVVERFNQKLYQIGRGDIQ